MNDTSQSKFRIVKANKTADELMLIFNDRSLRTLETVHGVRPSLLSAKPVRIATGSPTHHSVSAK